MFGKQLLQLLHVRFVLLGEKSASVRNISINLWNVF